MDMIQFYQENYIPNLVFPKEWNEDVSGQIFKYYPFYPAISKSTYKPQLYYEQYCDLEISFNEFINYIKNQRPDTFVILGTKYNKDHYINIQLLHVEKHENNYDLLLTFISPNGIHTDEFEDYNDNEVIKFMIDFYKNKYDTGQYYEKLWYDLETAEQIYLQRQNCVLYNKNYGYDMIIKYIDNIVDVPDIIGINSFLIYYSFYLFILYNRLIVDDDKEDINDAILTFIELLDQGVPHDVKTLKILMEPYDIKNAIKYENNKIIL
jgi:hypothetical protein